jgi:hypothetical protein
MRFLRWIFGPKHAVESVALQILKGLEDGSVVLGEGRPHPEEGSWDDSAERA